MVEDPKESPAYGRIGGKLEGGISPDFLREFTHLSLDKDRSDAETPGAYIPSMDTRIGKLEGTVEGLRHSQNLTLGGLTILVAVVLGGFGYMLNRIDALDNRVVELPTKISAELRDISKTLAESIAAAKQQPPQIILMQAPAPQLPPSPRAPQQ
jgi:hypothetical protein